MGGSRLRWLVAFGGAWWTWFLANWGGVSPTTSLWRAVTVFVMLAAAWTVLQAVFLAWQEHSRGEEERPVLQEASEVESPPQRDAA